MKKYKVYLHHQTKPIGFQFGAKWGGVVNHFNGHDVVGVVRKHPEGDFYLDASRPHHTGKRYNGEKISVDNRPAR